VRVGIPTEVKPDEYRVAVTPAGVRELCVAGHEVLVQSGAGDGVSLRDADYAGAGARMVDDATEVWAAVDLVCKVKEPVAEEYAHLRADLTLFAYLHLAADRPLTEALIASKCTAIAYETVTGTDGHLPLLAPMSEVAGRMASQVGASRLERPHGGRGVLMGGAPGVLPARVVVVGAGTAGRNAAAIAAGMEANVTVLDIDVERLREIDSSYRGQILTLASNTLTLEEQLGEADLVIGAVLVPGARAPQVITRDMVASMPPGAVLVDISIDQGGCAESSRMTTHRDPTFVVDDVVHYCVGNMPGAVPRTSTYALTNATMPYMVRLATEGILAVAGVDAGVAAGLNVVGGVVTNPGVAEAHGLAYAEPSALLAERA
jgi:alanine dehydrogenase